jgi:Phosphomethylpyrimidine kinase
VITAFTAPNTLGVRAVEDMSPGTIAAQIDAIYEDNGGGRGHNRHGLAGRDHRRDCREAWPLRSAGARSGHGERSVGQQSRRG